MNTPTTPTTPPIVCDMTGARDTPAERIAEYARLCSDALIGRERIEDAIRFRFRAGECADVEHRVRDLATREKACCAFFTFTVTTRGDEVWWDAAVVDDATARQVLDELYRLPETVAEGAPALEARFTDRGLRFRAGDPTNSTHDARDR